MCSILKLLTALPASAALADTAPILNATVMVTVLRADGTFMIELQLQDDGLHDDGDPGDGAYGSVFTPTLPGAYLIKTRQLAWITLDACSNGPRTDSTRSATCLRTSKKQALWPSPPFLRSSACPTQWKKYSLIIIGPDNELPG